MSKYVKALSISDFLTIEKIYKIRLPREFKEIYSGNKSFSEQFYNWGDFSEENVSKIKWLIKEAKNGIYRNIGDVEWCNEWGEEPQSLYEREEIIKRKLCVAPDLIPISGHRYIAAMDDVDKSPVLSVVDADIIYYSADLKGYFSNQKISKDTLISNLPYIPFWTDIM